MSAKHIPVMLDEVIDVLAPRDGAIYVDATFGGGGYTEALLSRAKCVVYAIDRDPEAIRRGASLAEQFGDRLTLIEGRFSEMDVLVHAQADGVAFDVGVSSFQLDDARRGFSFAADGPLDMRMSAKGRTAADAVNTLSEAELTDILRRYGEEKRARAVARAIIAARPITRTRALAEIVEKALGPSARKQAIHPATRSFQALRIYVNDELGELERGLEAAERTLKPMGRLAVVAFHSLEDRIVKRFLTERAGKLPRASRHAPDEAPSRAPTFRLLPPSPRMPRKSEIEANPRSRSARLRAAERTSAPAWSELAA
jgi:16S rRNA (cytosine1402-N4)-methyltransferase